MRKTFLKLLVLAAAVGTQLPMAAQEETRIQNPMLWADVPDPDVIRVGDTF